MNHIVDEYLFPQSRLNENCHPQSCLGNIRANSMVQATFLVFLAVVEVVVVVSDLDVLEEWRHLE